MRVLVAVISSVLDGKHTDFSALLYSWLLQIQRALGNAPLEKLRQLGRHQFLVRSRLPSPHLSNEEDTVPRPVLAHEETNVENDLFLQIKLLQAQCEKIALELERIGS